MTRRWRGSASPTRSLQRLDARLQLPPCCASAASADGGSSASVTPTLQRLDARLQLPPCCGGELDVTVETDANGNAQIAIKEELIGEQESVALLLASFPEVNSVELVEDVEIDDDLVDIDVSGVATLHASTAIAIGTTLFAINA